MDSHLIPTSWVAQLGLQPHPEGGYYRRLLSSEQEVSAYAAACSRPAMTVIYYALGAGAFARWHRLRADELWHFVEGSPLEIYLLSPDFKEWSHHTLGTRPQGGMPLLHVPGGTWQAAVCPGQGSLVTCTVAPGFDFADHQFLDDPASQAAVRQAFPHLAGWF